MTPISPVTPVDVFYEPMLASTHHLRASLNLTGFGAKALMLVLIFLVCGQLWAQDLEPRRWSRLPTGVNFVGAGLGNTTGDVLFDPVLNLQDVTVDYTVLGASFIHTFALYGKSARVDVTVPYGVSRWQGLLNGEHASVKRQGFFDPSVRLSVNLYGAPALKGKEFGQFMAEHRVNTTVGAAIGLILPTGEYFSDKLLNLGGNRWAVRPQLGMLHEHNKWQFEVTGAVFLYGDNRDFYPGNQVREQDPLWSLQAHLIHTFKPGLWASISSGYAWGGKSAIGGIAKKDDNKIAVWALSLGVPITSRQGLKFAYINSQTRVKTGADVDTFTVAWSMMLGH